MQKPEFSEIEKYYDEHLIGKLRDYVLGNIRVEAGAETVEKWGGDSPKKILEVGCGIGAICWRMSKFWPRASVLGLDISDASIEFARKVFSSESVRFEKKLLEPGSVGEQFDLVVLMDVYEHIAGEDRPQFNAALKEVLSDNARIILTFPTPRKQQHLRETNPEGLQPVEEDISPAVLVKTAAGTDTDLIYYEDKNIWRKGDYGHAVLARESQMNRCAPRNRGRKTVIKKALSEVMRAPGFLCAQSRPARMKHLEKQLGEEQARKIQKQIKKKFQ